MVLWLIRWRQGMLGIPYRVHQLQRIRRNHGNNRRSASANNSHSRSSDFRVFLSESSAGPPILMRRMTGWTFGSKVMAATAGFILVAGIILTLLTMNSSWLQLEAYRPIIFTILGILFIIIGPMVVCRMVLNAYDRRLAREQRQFECFAQQLRRREAETQSGTDASLRAQANQLNTPRSRARLAVDYLLDVAGVSGRRNSRSRDPTELFPGKLPSYESALDLDNAHWSTKFFDYQRDPPPAYHDVIEMETIRVHNQMRRRGPEDREDVSSDPPSYPLNREEESQQEDALPDENLCETSALTGHNNDTSRSEDV